MVPLKNFNFFQYKEEVKQAINQRISLLDSEWDPFTASWLAYALSQDGIDMNQPFQQLVERLANWGKADKVRTVTRHLGALCFLAYFFKKMDKDATGVVDNVLEQVERLRCQKSYKFLPTNDPEQIFPMALLASALNDSQDLKDFLKEIAQKGAHGTLKRQVLFRAALIELGETSCLPTIPDLLKDPGDIISLVWFCKRYNVAYERIKLWSAFANIKESISLYQDEEKIESCILSASEIAMLYEALTLEIINPDPYFLFELYPIHPRVREIATSLYKKGEYQNAVEEATKALNAFIQEKTGSKKKEVELVQSTMKNFPKPTIQFVSNLEDDSGKNEQAGLALISEGIFKAFRNPKAHTPKDAPELHMDAWETLDQLIVISYIFKRIEKAKLNL